MLKRDSLTAQMQELSHVLAKVKRLILEDRETEALDVLKDTLQRKFTLDVNQLIAGSTEEFTEWLNCHHLEKEEVDQLAYFIDEYAGLQNEFRHQLPILKKLLIIYDLLENRYAFISFAHLQRKNLLVEQLEKFL